MSNEDKKATPRANPLAKKDEKKDKNVLKTPLEIVVMGEAAKRFKSSMWDGLVKQAALVKKQHPKVLHTEQRMIFEDVMLVGEVGYMEKYHGKTKEAKFAGGSKKGEWKFRSYLPGAYRTAKSVAANCLEEGVSMVGSNEETVGKSDCEAKYRASQKSVLVPKTPMDKVVGWTGAIDRQIPWLSTKQKLETITLLQELVKSIQETALAAK